MKSKRIKVEKNLKCATCYACASHATRMCHMRWWDASRIWGSQISTFCHKMRHNLRLAGSTCDSHVVSHMGQFDSFFFFCKNQKLRLSISDFFFLFLFLLDHKHLFTTLFDNFWIKWPFGESSSSWRFEGLQEHKNNSKFNYPQINSKLTQISDLSSL